VDGTPADVELLLTSAQQEIEALRGDPRLEPPEGKRGQALHDHLLDLIAASEHRMAAPPGDGAPESVERAYARAVRESILTLRSAHKALPWLAATRRPTVNLGSLYLTEECAKVLVAPDVDLVLFPNPEFMYSATSWPFADVVENTPGFTPRTQRRPLVLKYPLSDSDRLLLHPLFAHELGHASADENDLVTKVRAALYAETAFVAELEATVERMGRVWSSPKTKIHRTIRTYLELWIEELLCDHLATAAMGPTFVCALAGFVLPMSYARPGQVHPPNTMRIRLSLDDLAERGWRPWFERVAPGIFGWLETIAADATGAMDIEYKYLRDLFHFLRDQLLRNADLLRSAASEQAGSEALDPSSTQGEADDAAELLKHLILPVGLGQPLAPRGILLGGWQEAFHRHGDHPKGLVKSLADRGLQDLLGKAIEMSTVVSTRSSL
jgi:hypothetical protein